jgi:Kdo2-lipid IVA lauroyltransferase/acyltransferase
LQFSTYKLEYVLLRIIQSLFSVLPRFVTLRIGTLFGLVLYWSGAYKKTVYGNIRYSGFWNEKEIKTIVPRLYRNMGRYCTDFLRISSKTLPYRVHNYEIVEKHIQEKKHGIIALLAHIGNWELLAQLFGKSVSNLNVVAKPMKNRFVDEWLAKKRTSTGVTTIYTKQALRKMFEVLAQKGIIAILIDQHAGQHGTMVRFMGKDANTVRTVAGIVHKTGCVVLPTYSIMQKNGTYDIFISEAPAPDISNKTSDQAIETYQLQHNDIISEWIKKYPEHYFGWFHKRYRYIIPYN